ncbi:MAG: response regulator [Candidatus Nanoarchaeia archaeon]|jgi:DNA-binding response OmpR family regulator
MRSPLIFVVDDEPDIRKSVSQILEDEGLRVETLSNGHELINQLKTVKPDLIILDILMPGPTTKDIMKEMEKYKPMIPIIFLTVVRFAETIKQDLIKGYMADYIEKPFDNKDLVKRVKSVLKM